MRRTIAVVILLAVLPGCKTIVKLDNSTDPRSFDPIVFAGAEQRFDEIAVSVPGEIRDTDFEITRVILSGSVRADTLVSNGEASVRVDLYIGLEPGPAGLDDPFRNEFIASVTVTEAKEHHPVFVRDPAIAFRALRRETVWIKAIISPASPTAGTLAIEDLFFEVWLERETGGLLSFFYLF